MLIAESSAAQEAAAAWAQRDQPGQTERAISLWEQALREDPKQNEVLIQLASSCGRIVRSAKTKSDRQRWAEKAKAYGAEAVARNPNNSQAYVEDAAALGQWAQARKGLGSLKAREAGGRAAAESNRPGPQER